MKASEIIGTVIACVLGCAIIELVGYFVGWTSSVVQALVNWGIYSVCTSAVVVALTVWGVNHSAKDKDDKL